MNKAYTPSRQLWHQSISLSFTLITENHVQHIGITHSSISSPIFNLTLEDFHGTLQHNLLVSSHHIIVYTETN